MPENNSPPPLPYATPAPPTSEERTLGILCHLLGLLTGFLGPLILWLVKKNESAFVADQGREALNFQITVLIASFGAALACFICIGFALLPAVAIGNIVFCIMAVVAVSDGKAYRYPWCLRLISQQVLVDPEDQAAFIGQMPHLMFLMAVHLPHPWQNVMLSPGLWMSLAVLVLAFALAAWAMGIMAQAAILIVAGVVLAVILLLGIAHWRMGGDR